MFSLIAVVFVFASHHVDAQDDSIIGRAERYSLALKKLEKGKGRKSVESVYRKGQSVAEKTDELENLNETKYALVEKKMRGFVVNRDEIVFIKPKADFFKMLSKKFGTRADSAFFTFLSELKPDNIWSAFIEQQTDYSGCTIYGKGILTGLYGKAKRFRRQYPSAYAADIKEEIDEMKGEFSDGTCACGDVNSVVKEFRLFIKTLPFDELTPVVKTRLKTIQNKQTAMRFNCLSG